MDRIKVLNFPIGNVNGGITQYALKNWEYIDKKKFKFDFATMNKKLDFEEELIATGADVFYINKYAEEDEDSFVQEIKKILENGYDIIHLHTLYWKSFLVEEIAKECGVPKIIVHSHCSFVDVADDEIREKALQLHNVRKNEFSKEVATDFWACSKIAGEWLYKKEICNSDMKVMYNAIDLEKFKYNVKVREKLKEELALKNNFVIGHIGRFDYQKNHNFLIDVFIDVCKRIPTAKLILIGVGKLKNEIISKIEENHICDKVLLYEKIDNVNEMLQVMDVFVLPSRFEGLPFVLIEAQAAGLKCIASDNITAEAKILNATELLPLNRKLWIEKICEVNKGYERVDTSNILRDYGYDINTQIKKLEKAYLNGLT